MSVFILLARAFVQKWVSYHDCNLNLLTTISQSSTLATELNELYPEENEPLIRKMVGTYLFMVDIVDIFWVNVQFFLRDDFTNHAVFVSRLFFSRKSRGWSVH